MRRLPLLFFIVYLTFIGGGTYYSQFFAVRVAHHMLMTLLLGGWLLHRIRTQGGLPRHPWNPLLVAAITLWLISAVFALDTRISLEAAWFSITHVIILWVMIAMTQQGRSRFLMEASFLMGALVIIFAGVQFLAWLNQWLPQLNAELPLPPVLPRLDQPFGVSTWLSGVAAPFALLLFVWGNSARRKDEKIVLLFMAGLMTIVLLFTASRGGYLSLGAGVLVLVGSRLWSRKRLNRLIPFLFGVGVFWIILLIVVFMVSQSGSRVASDTLRLDLWNSAFDSVSADPVTGVGIGMFGRAHRVYRDGPYVDDRLATAHSLYLNTMAETGIGGIALLLIFGGTGLHLWRTNWRSAETDREKFRLEGAAAALIGIGVHSIFDNFTLTSTALLPLVLLAYTTTPCVAVLTNAPRAIRSQRLAATGLLTLVGFYGLGLLRSDQAQSEFDRSVTEKSREAVQIAIELDPALGLYHLQNDYLTGIDPNAAVSDRIEAFHHALDVEPTWDTGWINLASLQLNDGNTEGALQSLERAAQISNANGEWFYWARLAEEQSAASTELIAERYRLSLVKIPVQPEFWLATEPRRLAIELYVENMPIETQYRTYTNLGMDEAAATLISDNPTTASEWWMSGHYALTVENDPTAAIERFNHGLAICKACGTLYAWRAQARAVTDGVTPDVQRDLRIAYLLTSPSDNLDLIRVQLAATPTEQRARQIEFVSSEIVSQNFEAVLFQGRRADFRSWIGELGKPLSDAEREVYFELATSYELDGDVEIAARIYHILLRAVPDDVEALIELARLEALQ